MATIRHGVVKILKKKSLYLCQFNSYLYEITSSGQLKIVSGQVVKRALERVFEGSEGTEGKARISCINNLTP